MKRKFKFKTFHSIQLILLSTKDYCLFSLHCFNLNRKKMNHCYDSTLKCIQSNLIVYTKVKRRNCLQDGLVTSPLGSTNSAMTTAMAAHQESIHERLQPAPENPLYLHHGGAAWSDPADAQEEHSADMSPYYSMPKRNKRKNFKPRCAPNATTFSDDSNGNCEEAGSPINGNDRTTPDQTPEEDKEDGSYAKIGVKNFSLLKGGAVDLSRRLSIDSNENIDTNYQNRLPDDKKVDSFQRSYIHSLQINQEAERDRTVLNFSNLQNKTFCAKNPFAISQLIKTNSPPRRRESESDEEKGQDINANDRLEGQEPMETETQQNGDASNATNRILRDYAMNTMKELLGIYGLSSNEVADAISGQIRALEALQG